MRFAFFFCLCAKLFAFQANISIENNTEYYLTITGKGPGNTTSPIAPGEKYTYQSEETYNTKNLLFWVDPNEGQPFMQGNCSFGPLAGVYVDRGWMAMQTLCMEAKANDASFEQCENGGKTLLAWNAFEDGGAISLDFFHAPVEKHFFSPSTYETLLQCFEKLAYELQSGNIYGTKDGICSARDALKEYAAGKKSFSRWAVCKSIELLLNKIEEAVDSNNLVAAGALIEEGLSVLRDE